MPNKDNIITSLDLGASKVCCLIGRVQRPGMVDVIGCGVSHHSSLLRGVVTDLKGLTDSISKAVYQAEDSCGEKIQSAYVNISGSHIEGVYSRGEIVISDKDNEITKRDIERVIESAKAINLPYDRDIIYTVKKDFIVDNEKGILNPAGMFGLKLETELYLVSAKIAAVDNLRKAVRQAGLSIDEEVISGVATSSSVLSDHEKDLGVILVDMGADLTEITVFIDDALCYLGSVPFGGDDITNAVAEKLRIPEGVAERLKIEHSTLDESARDDKIAINNPASSVKSTQVSELRQILIDQYKGLFEEVKKKLSESNCAQDAASGIVMCGQSAMMEGSLEMAELCLNFPVKMGNITGLGSSPKALPSHIYATSVGLLKHASFSRNAKKSIISMGPKNMVLAAVDYARQLYSEYF